MKKVFLTKKSRCVALIAVLVLLAVSATVFATFEVGKQPETSADGENYGAYNDSDDEKAFEKKLFVGTKTITLKYLRTENLKENPVAKRADSYGTYDIYVDDEQTEYMYLLNSDIYCGFKLNVVGTTTEKDKAISEDKALSIAEDFLTNNRANHSNYVFESCEYSELAGYYDIRYYLPISGYKSDDVIRIWVDAQGKVTSFSEFNYLRYERLIIDTEKYTEADKKLIEFVDTQANKTNYTVVDAYISIDNSGRTVLIKEVDFTITTNGETFIQRKRFSQEI